MRIYDNGIYRDMTPAEIAARQTTQTEEHTAQPLTEQDKLSLLLASIPEEPMPSVEPKLGYKWQPMYTPSSGFAWTLVEDPTALGTVKNPWYWLTGMAVKLGHHYTQDGSTIMLAVQDGVPPVWADAEFFEEAG